MLKKGKKQQGREGAQLTDGVLDRDIRVTVVVGDLEWLEQENEEIRKNRWP